MKPTIYLATDHAGFELKNVLAAFLRDELGYTVVDCGAESYESADDYPDFMHTAAQAVAAEPDGRIGIILGGSGQGEAMVANRYAGVRAVVFYGDPSVTAQADADGTELSIVTAARQHNNANVLSLGARFLNADSAKAAVQLFLETSFSHDARHERRIKKIDHTE